MKKTGRPPKPRKVKADLPVEVTFSEIVDKVEAILKPFQSNLDIGIEKANDKVVAISLNVKINL